MTNLREAQLKQQNAENDFNDALFENFEMNDYWAAYHIDDAVTMGQAIGEKIAAMTPEEFEKECWHIDDAIERLVWLETENHEMRCYGVIETAEAAALVKYLELKAAFPAPVANDHVHPIFQNILGNLKSVRGM